MSNVYHVTGSAQIQGRSASIFFDQSIMAQSPGEAQDTAHRILSGKYGNLVGIIFNHTELVPDPHGTADTPEPAVETFMGAPGSDHDDDCEDDYADEDEDEDEGSAPPGDGCLLWRAQCAGLEERLAGMRTHADSLLRGITKRNAMIASTTERLRAADAEIAQVLEERDRLRVANHKLKDELLQAQCEISSLLESEPWRDQSRAEHRATHLEEERDRLRVANQKLCEQIGGLKEGLEYTQTQLARFIEPVPPEPGHYFNVRMKVPPEVYKLLADPSRPGQLVDKAEAELAEAMRVAAIGYLRRLIETPADRAATIQDMTPGHALYLARDGSAPWGLMTTARKDMWARLAADFADLRAQLAQADERADNAEKRATETTGTDIQRRANQGLATLANDANLRADWAERRLAEMIETSKAGHGADVLRLANQAITERAEKAEARLREESARADAAERNTERVTAKLFRCRGQLAETDADLASTRQALDGCRKAAHTAMHALHCVAPPTQ